MGAPIALHALCPTGTGGTVRWTTFRKIIACFVAIAFAVLLAPGSVAWADDGGPGKWYDAIPGGARPGSQAWDYEAQIKGGDPGQAYWVPYPETRQRPGFDMRTWAPTKNADGTWDGVAFDGYDRVRGELLEAKGSRYAYLLDPANAEWSKAGQE